MSARNSRLAQNKPILCYVTDRRSLQVAPQQDAIAALVTKLQEIISAGVDWVQIREKDVSAKELSTLTGQALQCSAMVARAHAPKTRVFVNDRVDVALAQRAAGIHLGEKSLRPEDVKALLKSSWAGGAAKDFSIGVSCHSLEAARCAEGAGADYIFFGPIFETPSKNQYGAPQGLSRLEAVCTSVSIPVLAIGGIALENAASCIKAGAKGLAAIRVFQDASDAASVVRELRALVR